MTKNDTNNTVNKVTDLKKEWLMKLLPIIAFALVAVAFFFPADTQGLVLRQHDVQQGLAIGQEVKAFTDSTGEASRWTNSLFSGMPNFQISPSYESSKPVSLIGKILTLGLPSPANLVFVMLLGFYILMLALGVRWHLAMLGAFAYAFSSYFIIIIGAGHIWKYITLSYIPPTIAGIVWAYRGRYLLGSVVAALFATLQIAGNHVQMTYYFLFVIVAIVVACCVSAYREKQMKRWAKATVALAFAAVLAVAANSPSLYNTYEYSKETMRGGHSELTDMSSPNATSGGLNKDYITAWSYGIDETLSLFVPNINGGANIKPEKGSNMPLLLSDLDAAKKMSSEGKIQPQEYQALGSFFQYFGDQPGTNGPVYVGALVFVLFVLGCVIVKGPLKWALLVSTILSILLSWGHNMMWLTDWFIDYFPLYSKFRTVSSILVIAEFTIPVLAVLALKQLVEEKDALRHYKTAIYVSFGAVAFLCLLMWISPSVFVGDAYSIEESRAYVQAGYMQMYPELFSAVENLRYGMVKADAMRSLLIIAVGFALLLLYANGKLKTTGFVLSMAAVVLVDLYTVNKRYLDNDSFTDAPAGVQQFAMRPVDRAIKQDTAINYRVLDIPNFTSAMPSYFHKMVGGYHAAKLTRYQDLMNRHIQISQEGININPMVMDMLNTRYVIFNDTVVERNPTALGNAWFVDKIEYVDSPDAEIDSLSSFNPINTAISDKRFKTVLGETVNPKMPGDTIYEITYAPNRLIYHAKTAKGGLAVFSEVYFPWGWDITVDGKPAEMGRVNYVLRAMQVPAGEHTIEFRFDPKSVRITETVAFVAVGILFVGMAILVAFGIVNARKKE